jgi:uncharacterized protein with FMN-binding domain
MKNIQGFAFFLFAIAGLLAAMFLSAACAGFVPSGRTGSAAGIPAETGAAVKTGGDGVYEGVGRGHRGPVRVRVRMEGGNIAEIEIVDSGEDRFVGGAAMEELLELALMYNTTDLDAISGATESSEGFLAALEHAVAGHE